MPQPPSPILSSSGRDRFQPWLLLGLFWALCLPATLAIPEELARGNTPILFVLLLDAVGLYLLHLAIRGWRDWRRYGPAPLQLQQDPIPSGQPMLGEVVLTRPLPGNADVWVTLSQVRQTTTGSGKTFRSSRVIEWQDRQALRPEQSASGARLRFRFDLPTDAAPSEPTSSHYRFWELVLNGPDLQPPLLRVYPITVKASADPVPIPADASLSPRGPETKLAAPPAGLKQVPGGLERREGLRENARSALLSLPFGAGFGGGAVALWHGEVLGGLKWLFVIPFGIVAAFILLNGLLSLLGTWQLRLTHRGIETRFALLGLLLRRREIAASDFGNLSLRKTGQVSRQNEPLQEWAVMAENTAGTVKIPLLEHFTSRREAEEARRWLSCNGPFPMPVAEDHPDQKA